MSNLKQPNLKREEVENLAHALWEMRGKPLGSPEVDWLEAERLLSHPEIKVEQHWLEKSELPTVAMSMDEQFNDEDTAPEEIPGAIDLDAELEKAAASPGLVAESLTAESVREIRKSKQKLKRSK